jgi:hypothetical protein
MLRRTGVRCLLAASLLLLASPLTVAPASDVPKSAVVMQLSRQRAQALQTIPLKVSGTVVYNSGGSIHVDGMLVNESSSAVGLPQMSVTIKDSTGAVLASYSGGAGAYRVAAGESTAFSRSFAVYGGDPSALATVVTASGIREFEPRPVVLTEVNRSYAVSGGQRLYTVTFRNDSAYAVEGPTASGWEVDTNGALIDTLFAHEWVVLPPGGVFTAYLTGYLPFGLPVQASTAIRCEARPLGVLPPNTTIAGVPSGWSRSNVTFTLASTDLAATPHYDIGGGLTKYTGPVTISSEGRTMVEYLSVSGGLQGPSYETVVAIDKSAPRTISNAKTSYRGSATITLTPRDSVSGVRDTHYRLDSGSWRVGTRVVVRSLGRHTLRFYSRDSAGNVEAVRSVVFTVRP